MQILPCPRCSEHEKKFEQKNCGYSVIRKNNKVIQAFSCTQCQYEWEVVYEVSTDN